MKWDFNLGTFPFHGILWDDIGICLEFFGICSLQQGLNQHTFASMGFKAQQLLSSPHSPHWYAQSSQFSEIEKPKVKPMASSRKKTWIATEAATCQAKIFFTSASYHCKRQTVPALLCAPGGWKSPLSFSILRQNKNISHVAEKNQKTIFIELQHIITSLNTIVFRIGRWILCIIKNCIPPL